MTTPEFDSETLARNLKDELVARQQKNRQYSLRAYARSLGVSAASLSQILNGKRRITKKAYNKLALGIGMPEIQEENKYRLKPVFLDEFAIISEWYHYAILEMCRLKDFRNNLEWVSKRLGIGISKVALGVERLRRMGLMETDRLQETQAALSLTSLNEKMTSAAASKHQIDLLEKSVAAIETVPYLRRNHTSMMMTIDLLDLPNISKDIRNFRRTLSKRYEKKSRGDEIYQLQISLFPLTK